MTDIFVLITGLYRGCIDDTLTLITGLCWGCTDDIFVLITGLYREDICSYYKIVLELYRWQIWSYYRTVLGLYRRHLLAWCALEEIQWLHRGLGEKLGIQRGERWPYQQTYISTVHTPFKWATMSDFRKCAFIHTLQQLTRQILLG